MQIYDILKNLPLYKRRGREEVFLGILKSKNKNWCGWQYIAEIRKHKDFAKLLVDLGIYKLAENYWELEALKGKPITLENLLKNYNF